MNDTGAWVRVEDPEGESRDAHIERPGFSFEADRVPRTPDFRGGHGGLSVPGFSLDELEGIGIVSHEISCHRQRSERPLLVLKAPGACPEGCLFRALTNRAPGTLTVCHAPV